MPIKVSVTTDGLDTQDFLVKKLRWNWRSKLVKYGRAGVIALSNATPKDTGETASKWGFTIEHDENSVKITWTNDHIEDEWANIAILLQYGHATGTGGYVEGRDYINPAMRPIFDRMAKEIWGEIIE